MFIKMRIFFYSPCLCETICCIFADVMQIQTEKNIYKGVIGIRGNFVSLESFNALFLAGLKNLLTHTHTHRHLASSNTKFSFAYARAKRVVNSINNRTPASFVVRFVVPCFQNLSMGIRFL